MESLRQSIFDLAGWATNPDMLMLELSMFFLIIHQLCRSPAVHNLCVRLPLAKLQTLRAAHRGNTLAFLSAASVSELEERARECAIQWLDFCTVQFDRIVIYLGSFEEDRVSSATSTANSAPAPAPGSAATGNSEPTTTSSGQSSQQRQPARRLSYQPAVILVS